jgi:hypothetical protein
MREREKGQAAAEYVGLLALAAVVLAGAGAVVGLGDVGGAVAAGVRTGICLVGGDICRTSDAEAAGLAPCTVGEDTRGGGATLSIAVVRFGEAHQWVVATRSDGSVLVTRTSENKGGAATGVGIEASPIGVSFGVEGKLDVTLMSGSTWELPDAGAAARLIAADDDDRPPPTWKFGELGGVLTGEAEAKLAGLTLSELEATARGAGGVRLGRGRTTVYVHGRLRSGATVWTPGHGARVAGPSTGDVMVELTLEHGEPREVAFRTTGQDAGPGRVVDTAVRLDLRDPDNRAAASDVLERLRSSPPILDLRPLMLYAVQRGTVERSVYDVRSDSSDFELGVKLGLELGLDAETVKVQRRLVAASAWTGGAQERVREDCLM